MQVSEVTRYTTADGRQFTSREAAEQYAAQAEHIQAVMSLLPPAPDSTNYANGDGYIQHRELDVRQVWNTLLRLAGEYLGEHKWYTQSLDFGADSSWAGRLIGESDHKALWKAWFRMTCLNRNTMREYGQPFFAANPDKAPTNRLNP